MPDTTSSTRRGETFCELVDVAHERLLIVRLGVGGVEFAPAATSCSAMACDEECECETHAVHVLQRDKQPFPQRNKPTAGHTDPNS
jgi:hypothetical protein